MHLPNRTTPLLLLLLLAFPADSHAQASPGEWLFHGGPTYVGSPDLGSDHRGAGLQLGTVLGLPNAFTLGADISTARILALRSDEPNPEDDTRRDAWGHHTAYLGFGANIDILSVIPWTQIAAGLHTGQQEEGRPARFALRASLGFDYRPRRTWSTGAVLQWSSFAPDIGSFPDHAVVSLRFSWILSPSAL